MGIYKKTGIREFALNVVELITWIRLYGFSEGSKIFFSLLSTKNGFFYPKASFIPYPLKLRNNNSDKEIFKQVFLEKQYALYNTPFPEASTIIDGGANIGASAMYFAHLFPKAQILAIEPEESNFKLLKENTEKYHNIKCLQVGIWNKNEFINISNPESSAASFMVQSDAASETKIQGMTIDELMKREQWDRIDILKLDIESAEKEVFSADTEWLRKVRLLIIELHDSYKTGCTKAFFNAVNRYDYKAYFHHENIFVFFE